MRWSATKLRWVLLVGVLLLTGVVAGFFGLARYKAGKIWQRILARNGVNLRQETNGFTWSQSSGGRTVFTLHAAKATPLGKNKWALHDAALILYGREPGRDDRIYGREFQYDQDAGVARAIGEVHMDLQAPEPGRKTPEAAPRPALGFGPDDESLEGPGIIHVRTSGLVYMRKLGLAATGERAEFRYGGITCTSTGAEFDSAQSVVRLLADVKMTGTLKGAGFSLAAAHAELSRGTNLANLTMPVLLAGERSARAAHAVLHLRKDGSLETAEANGAMELRAGTRFMTAPRATAVFGTEDRPKEARLFTGVSFADTDRSRPAQGSASSVDLNWTPEGLLNTVIAQGAVQFGGSSSGGDGATERRNAAADRLLATFVPGSGAAARRAQLREMRLTGSAHMSSITEPVQKTGRATETAVSGDELTTAFGMGSAGKIVAQHLTGTGHTRLEQTSSDGARRQSTGDALEISLAPASAGGAPGRMQVASAVQSGKVEVTSWAVPKAGQSTEQTNGQAARAVYAGAEQTLTLKGSGATRGSLKQSQGELQAAEIVIDQKTGDAEASGGVVATSMGNAGEPAMHVLATRARLLHAAGLTEFFGDNGQPAQLWQGGSQVQAAEITLDGRQHNLSASPGSADGEVTAVFATPGKQGGSAASPESASAKRETKGQSGESLPQAEHGAARVVAAKMDYDDLHHQAVFTGGVRLLGAMGEVTADRGVAILKPGTERQAGAAAPGGGPNLSGSLERMVLLGDVRLTQPGRTGTGEQLTYTAATDNFALTGAPGRPPRVTGEQGSTVSGATLLFHAGDSTIIVAGTEGGPKAQSGTRVHTETDLKQQNH